MWAATRSKTVGAVQEVLLVDRFQQHRYRSLDDRIFERGVADLDGVSRLPSRSRRARRARRFSSRCYGRRLRRDPVNARGTGLARVTVCLPQKVLIDQGGQGRAYPHGVAGRLCRKALKFRVTGGDLKVSPVGLSSST